MISSAAITTDFGDALVLYLSSGHIDARELSESVNGLSRLGAAAWLAGGATTDGISSWSLPGTASCRFQTTQEDSALNLV
jgi:hypothetical protein